MDKKQLDDNLDAFKAIIKSYTADAKLKKHWAAKYPGADQYAMLGNTLAQKYDKELYAKMQKVSQSKKEMDEYLLNKADQ